MQGKTIAQVAKAQGKDPIDLIFDLLAQDPGMSVAVFGMSEEDVAYILKQPWVSIDNDSQGTAPMAFWDGSIRTRAPMEPSRASCANTSVKISC